MPNGEKLPPFPTQFGEEDVERLEELTRQRKALQEAYQGKFSKEAWAKVPPSEKLVRAVSPELVSGILRVIPGIDVTRFGATPEQFQERVFALEEDYKELVRRERVTKFQPAIQRDLVALALSGQLADVLTPAALKETFPELKTGFTEEEIGYFSRVAEAFLHATPEQIISGELFVSEPMQLPITEEDVAKFFPEEYDPRAVFASVGFAKDFEEIMAAIRQSFPPQGESPEKKVSKEEALARLQEYYQGGKKLPTKEEVTAAHLTEEERMGQSKVLVDVEGNFIRVWVTPDKAVWAESREPIPEEGVKPEYFRYATVRRSVGYLTDEGKIVPYGLHGQPLINEEAKESMAKDWWDAWYLASNSIGLRVEQTAFNLAGLIAKPFLFVAEKAAPFTVIGDEEAKKRSVEMMRWMKGQYAERQKRSEAEFREWLLAHPELQPRAEWVEEGGRGWTDPGKVGYTMISNAPIAVGALTTGIGISYLTGNPWTGAKAAAAVMAPVIIGDLTADLIENGMSYEDATVVGLSFGTAMSAVEILPWGITMKILHPVIARRFTAELRRELASVVTKNLTLRGALGKATKSFLAIETAEVLEENIQNVMTNVAVRIVNENRGLIEGASDITIGTLWSVAPMAFMGGAASYYSMKAKLSPSARAEIDTIADKLEEAGLDREQAEAVAMAEVVETETGVAEIVEAAEKVAPTSVNWSMITLDPAIPEHKVALIKENMEAFVPFFRMGFPVGEIRINRRLRRKMAQYNVPKGRMDFASPGTITKENIFHELGHAYSSALIGLKDFELIKSFAKTINRPFSQELIDKRYRELLKEYTYTAEEMTGVYFDAYYLTHEKLEEDFAEKLSYFFNEPDSAELSAEVRSLFVNTFGEPGSPAPRLLSQKKDLSKKLSMVNEQLATFEASFAVQQGRLLKMTLPNEIAEQQDTLKSLEGILTETRLIQEAYQEKLREVQEEIDKAEAIPKAEAEVITAYRGISELTPVDRGHFGLGMTFSTRKDIAQRYAGVGGRVETKTIRLENPYIIDATSSEGIAAAEAFAKRGGEVTTPELKKVGYDGVIVRGWHGGKGDEIVVFYPERSLIPKAETVVPEPEELLSPLAAEGPVPTTGPVSPATTVQRKRPWLIPWEKELERTDKALSDPKIARLIKLPKKLREVRERAETTLNFHQAERQRIKDELTAIKNKKKEGNKEKREALREELSGVESSIKAMASKASLSSKTLLGKSWGDLPPSLQAQVAFSFIEDGSLKFGGEKEILDMEYFFQKMQELTGMPMYTLFRRLDTSGAAAETAKEKALMLIKQNPNFDRILKDEKSMARAAQILNARNKIQGVEEVLNPTWDELLFADHVAEIYSEYKPVVRYLRVMRTKSTFENFKVEFPDAVAEGKEEELKKAIELKESGDRDALWSYLLDLDWGVIGTGYDYRAIAHPGLILEHRKSIRDTRGIGRLLERETVSWPEGKLSMSLAARVASYVEQMELQARMGDTLDEFVDTWKMIAPKFSDYGQLEKGLKLWLERLQGIGLGYQWYDIIIRRLWRQSMAAVFWEPVLALRNSLQAIMLHPDRSELVKLIWEWHRIPADVRQKFFAHFETYVSQLGGLRKDWLHVGERGFPGLEWFNRLADSINLYGLSDQYPRLVSAMASFNRAYKATEQLKKDGNIDRWIRNSGALHLRATERNYALTQYISKLGEKVNLGIAGLLEVPAEEAASLYLGERGAGIANFLYRRSQRGLMEQGKTGTTFWNLFVFPRGYGQRIYFQAEKIKNTLRGEATWEEAGAGFGDILKIVIVSMMFSQAFYLLTGRKRNPYDPLNILFGWQIGGLYLGVALEASEAMGDFVTIIAPYQPQEDKDRAAARLTKSIPRLEGTLIPFYTRAIDIAEVVMNKEQLDTSGLRQLRAAFDSKYTPAEVEEADRTLWENIRKGVLGGEAPDPTKLEVAKIAIADEEALLGTKKIDGSYYTLGDFGSKVGTLLNGIPNILITPEEAFSSLVLFYRESSEQWAELDTVKSKDKDAWRREHLLEEAMLIFWEKYKKSVYVAGSEEAEIVTRLLTMWAEMYNIDKYMHGEWANWSLPPKPTKVAEQQVPEAPPTSRELEETTERMELEREALRQLSKK